MGQAALTAWVWLAAVVFVAGCGWRAWRYAKAPVHLRWDLYPVAHEARGRRAYGGSHFEEREYWTKPQRRSVGGQVAVTLAEIAFLRGVWRNNRRIFWGSLPFHWGLYLLMATSGLLILPAIGVESGWLLPTARGSALAGGLLLAAGALRLLILRTTDPGLKRYSAPADRLNLGAFAALGALSAAVALGPHGMQPAASAVASALRFEPAGATRPVAAHMLLAGLILAYLPFTRMVHFFAKYFLYHDVRWDDRPVIPGSGMEKRLRAALNFGVSWSADHVGPGQTWKDVAAGAPPSRRKP